MHKKGAIISVDEVKQIKKIVKEVKSDHDKFGRSGAVTFSGFEGTVVITDKSPEKMYYDIMNIKVD